MEDIRASVKLDVQDVLAELDFLLSVDQRRELYEPEVVRKAVHRWVSRSMSRIRINLISDMSDSGCQCFSSTAITLKRILLLSPQKMSSGFGTFICSHPMRTVKI